MADQMNRTDAKQLVSWSQEVAASARTLIERDAQLDRVVDKAMQALLIETQRRDGKGILSGGSPRVDLAAVGSATKHLVVAARGRERVRAASSATLDQARVLLADLDAAASSAKPAISRLRRTFSRKTTRDEAQMALLRLQELRQWVTQRAFAGELSAAQTGMVERPEDGGEFWADVLRRPQWYAELVGAQVGAHKDPVVESEAVRQAARLARVLPNLSRRGEVVRDGVRRSFELVQAQMVRATLAEMPLVRLKDVTSGRLRFGPLEAAGVTSVQHVLDARPGTLTQIVGVGEQTASQVVAAARQLAKAVSDDLRFRINLDPSDANVTRLVQGLHTLNPLASVERTLGLDDLTRLTDALRPLGAAEPPHHGLTVFLPQPRPMAAIIRETVTWMDRRDGWTLLERAQTALERGPADPATVWADFAQRSPEYYTLLAQLVDLKLDEGAEAGTLPAEIVERIHAQPLDESLNKVSLRGYQSFGARFCLVQKRVIIGDEMGLGKTIQALAVLAHLRAVGVSGRLLVICPASVLVNWTREIAQRSQLRVHRLHGIDRQHVKLSWLKYGDVAVTTFETLRSLDLASLDFALVVVDEAHLLKNPATQRSRNTAGLLQRAERVLFLTGTPLENRVSEFRSLVYLLKPHLVASVNSDVVNPDRFRNAVAPAYLRRNQEDVLAELPELVINDEWEEFSPTDRAAYLREVAAGNFMGMRRAAFAMPGTSTKMARLREVVDEAAANGHKVIIFSFFRDVLDSIATELRHAYGPLTGSLAPFKRQDLVDRFAAATDGAVLLSQIQAGGVGLNMQAGSIVIICEPQVKPTLEAQAIARAHRMGQVRGVQVHRLLTPDSIDQRMIEILNSKQRLFDEYVRRSDIANASPEAVDISEAKLAKTIVDEEQARLAMASLGQAAQAREHR